MSNDSINVRLRPKSELVDAQPDLNRVGTGQFEHFFLGTDLYCVIIM